MIKIDQAKKEDSADIFFWRNNLYSRMMFRRRQKIKFSQHKIWYFNSLRSKSSIILICKTLEEHQSKIGVVRFNILKHKYVAEVSINLSPKMRRKGLGLICLKKSIKFFKEKFTDCKYLTANVKIINIPSIKIFKNSGFEIVKKQNQFLLLLLKL
tara:strand:- start:376 stop:840 length:465 start_codon:yes stop_codon:yes gene_type:complete